METIEIDGKQYEVTGHAEDGLPILKGVATVTEEGTDKDGNPIRSVNVNVPAVGMGVTPGEIS